MAFMRSIIQNIGQLSKQVLPGSPLTNDEVGYTNTTYSTQQDPNDREAIYPNWFFSARLGQPRQVDTRKLRNLAQSPWAQMVITTFKKQITTIPWEILPEDEDDATDRTVDIKIVTDFFLNMNVNKQTVNDVNSELITDIAEIDAGCLNYIYTVDSYVIGDIPVYNAWGQVVSFETGLVLKELGQRQLRGVKAVDGSTMLKQVDIHKNLLSFWQYSFKHPRQNPTRFEVDEIEYVILNPRSYDVYGFSPMQSIQQVLELLVQGTRYNKDLYLNNAIPDILISLPKLPKEQLRILKRTWNNQYKGKPHQVGFINWAFDNIHKLASNNRDLEWLNGQKWYFKIVFGSFGVSPEEAGFFEDSNKATTEGQERVTVRNALKPYMQRLEQVHTRKSISEILGRADHGLVFRFFPKDHALEKIEFEQDMQELDHNTLTINEYRKKKGRDVVEWGDKPQEKPSMFGSFGDQDKGEAQSNPKDNNNDDDKNKMFKKNFEAYINDSKYITDGNTA